VMQIAQGVEVWGIRLILAVAFSRIRQPEKEPEGRRRIDASGSPVGLRHRPGTHRTVDHRSSRAATRT